MTTPVPRVKEPHLAGRAYPASGDALRDLVRRLLAAAGPPRPGTVAIVVPHGPYAQSGAVAARGFAAARRPWRRAVVLAPSHFSALRGAAVLAIDGYRTPLGVVPIDGDAAVAIARPPLVRVNPAAFLREPGVEAELPLLQAIAPECRLVPVLVGTLEPDDGHALAALLGPLLDGETLLVASSDLVHYGRRFGYLPVPPTDAATVAAAVRRVDEAALACIAAGDAERFVAWTAAEGAPVCGRHPIEVLLRTLPAGARGAVLGHATSLDATGEHAVVTGFGAVGFAI
ncbi:MAG TPA: AmmeMemoRadiSam system protein B [Candidatus Binatia bacterium]|nr:AmmeMemoRadiSam system protein B [Candidatus Binatia bacterium]